VTWDLVFVDGVAHSLSSVPADSLAAALERAERERDYWKARFEEYERANATFKHQGRDLETAEARVQELERYKEDTDGALDRAQADVQELERENALLCEEIRLFETSQIPVIPRAAQARLEAAEARVQELQVALAPLLKESDD
jgi:exonuclease VII small subunit